MKWFKNFSLKMFLRCLPFVIVYPLYKTVTASNRALAFSDSCLILSLVLLILGILYFLYQKGDFDNHTFLYSSGLKPDANYETFKKKQDEKRENSFNYPLLYAVILLALSGLSSLFA